MVTYIPHTCAHTCKLILTQGALLSFIPSAPPASTGAPGWEAEAAVREWTMLFVDGGPDPGHLAGSAGGGQSCSANPSSRPARTKPLPWYRADTQDQMDPGHRQRLAMSTAAGRSGRRLTAAFADGRKPTTTLPEEGRGVP